MKFILTVCSCIIVFCLSILIIACAIGVLDDTDFMDAIVERIRGKE